MYLSIQSESSCGRAWASAAQALINAGDEAYNVIIDVDDPSAHDDVDNAIISLVDDFLRDRNTHPIITVANTIFPQSLYEKFGSPQLFDEYFLGFDKLSSNTKRWGRYFERLSRHKLLNGETYNPLLVMIDRIKQQEKSGHRYSSAYELAVYDPLLDGRAFRGAQCLSFLSFKVHPDRGLMLTVMYRNHTYITRCLGNLIGLGRLQAFIAKECSLKIGPLTCISTHATIDTDPKWGLKDARALVKKASAIAA